MIYRLSNDRQSYTVSTHYIDTVWVQINHDEHADKMYGYVKSKDHIHVAQKLFNNIHQWHVIE